MHKVWWGMIFHCLATHLRYHCSRKVQPLQRAYVVLHCLSFKYYFVYTYLTSKIHNLFYIWVIF